MEILRFYKEETGKWYADVPQWTGRKSALQMIAGADKLLNHIAKERFEIYLHFSETEFDGASCLIFKRKSWFNGANYKIKNYIEKELNLKVWLCNVTLFVFNKFPKKIFFNEIDYGNFL